WRRPQVFLPVPSGAAACRPVDGQCGRPADSPESGRTATPVLKLNRPLPEYQKLLPLSPRPASLHRLRPSLTLPRNPSPGPVTRPAAARTFSPLLDAALLQIHKLTHA